MALSRHWPAICDLFQHAGCLLIASVSPDGFPHITPIGSLMLREDCTGWYLERFPEGLPRNLETCERIEVIALNHSPALWLRALVSGRFASLPGMRLRGTAGPRRPATLAERDCWLQKVRRLRWTKGHALLWKNMTHARDLRFEAYDPIRLGPMTAGLFEDPAQR